MRLNNDPPIGCYWLIVVDQINESERVGIYPIGNVLKFLPMETGLPRSIGRVISFIPVTMAVHAYGTKKEDLSSKL